MREDDPDYQTFCTLADNLYHEYPLKYPVAGKDTDIKKILLKSYYMTAIILFIDQRICF